MRFSRGSNAVSDLNGMAEGVYEVYGAVSIDRRDATDDRDDADVLPLLIMRVHPSVRPSAASDDMCV